MNAKSLPLQVAKELKEFSEYIKREIGNSGLALDLKPNKEFGFTVAYKSYRKLFFSLLGYDANYDGVFYKVVQIPNDPYTSIEESNEEESYNSQEELWETFMVWLSLVKNYEELNPVDFTNLFNLEPNELFLQNEPDIFSEKNQILTYCLKSLAVSNFQGIKHTTIENLPIDTNWVFLVGENGFGKSTILQAISLGLHGSKDGSYEFDQNENSRIKVEYKSDGGNLINDFRSNPLPLSQVAAYGPVRLNMQGSSSVSEVSEKSGTLYSLFKTDGVLLNVEFELIKWVLKKEKRFDLVKRAFLKLVPNLADVRFNSSNDRIEYIENDVVDGEEQYEPLPFEKIASGFRSILGMAGDMIIRLSNTQREVVNPSDLKGIVIIDELDLHWHPKLQKQIPKLFSEVFPNIQFIVSTHSPIPLLGAPKNSVILKVSRTKEEGITIQKVDIDLKTLTPNLLLTSGVFDMDDIFSSQLGDDLTEVRTEDTFEKMEENDDVDKYLKEFEKSNEQFPDELFEPKNK